MSLTGPGGLLRQITKTVLEAALNAELDEHVGYEKGDRTGKDTTNERNGAGAKTVTTDIGEVRIKVPRDRDGSFTRQIVPKHARRIEGFDETIISLYGKGLTTGEIQKHLFEIYDADVSRDLISSITDKGLVSCGEFSEFLPAGHGGSELEKCEEVLGFAFVAEGQASVSGEPGDGALDHPAVLAQFLGGFDALAGDPHADAVRCDPAAQRGLVVGLVRVQFLRSAPPGAAAGFDRGDGHDQWFERARVVGVRGGDRDGERQPAAIGHHVDLRARLAPVDRTGTGQRSPFFGLFVLMCG
ncbi:hypothetical protein FHU38_000151 [Saccharomonospora amisosensis]|uniref:Mutator family transposase n=1 Tax=Saccharomonospora amisosensis TaxID=1128677 RepID=A0A7X5ZNL8_9PSEU|nr:hypothetical protein [Saccharomonospora amisosensis]